MHDLPMEDFTQNQRLAQMNERILIIGIDVAKHKHVARVVDDQGWDLASLRQFDGRILASSFLGEIPFRGT
ncbi:IS110 family transposase [Thalassobacillus sp. CUG 92003]|uniref:IS110 family transposase n=1 Tax=Thalassobacillus sp. CUG 92003 TaxID=2736641 RepID=UPI002106A079|nr:IS110 family transposase [Thalassobacillus sp. CUG 92003]